MWLEVPVLTQARVLIADGSVGISPAPPACSASIRQQAEACHYVPQVIEATVLQSLDAGEAGTARSKRSTC